MGRGGTEELRMLTGFLLHIHLILPFHRPAHIHLIIAIRETPLQCPTTVRSRRWIQLTHEHYPGLLDS